MSRLPPYPIRPEVLRLRPYVPGKAITEVQREYGLTDVIKLASNENPLGPSPLVLTAVRQFATSAHLYPEPTALPLRDALAKRVGLSADAIMIGNGSDELLRLLAASFIQPGDRVVVPGCSFPNYRAVAELFGAIVTEVALANETMDLDAMAAAASGARFLFLCRPNNPTGAVFPQDRFERLMDTLSPSTLVVVDQAYHEFDESPFDALGLLERCPNLILTRTFSKAYGLAGLRIGYGMAHPDLWAPLLMAREPFSVNAVAQAAALAALDDEAHLAATLINNRLGRRRIEQLCNELDLPLIPTQANFVMIDVQRPALAVFEALLRKGVIVRPCDGFGRPTWIRVTIGTPDEVDGFRAALQAALAGV